MLGYYKQIRLTSELNNFQTIGPPAHEIWLVYQKLVSRNDVTREKISPEGKTFPSLENQHSTVKFLPLESHSSAEIHRKFVKIRP